MERLLVLKLAAQGCTAAAWCNGVRVAQAGGGASGVTSGVTSVVTSVVSVAVHEYALAGSNRLELVVEPDAPVADTAVPPEPAAQAMSAQLHLLLPRIGAPVDEGQARTLAQLSWQVAAGEPLALPARRTQEAELPIRFPRWRWLDAPVVEPTPALHVRAHAFLTTLMRDLARGQTDSFMAATRLRTEELALAYQRSPDEEAVRLRSSLAELYASARLRWQPLMAEDLRLRSLAGGRLLECLNAQGQAALTTLPDAHGSALALPLRLSVVEGRFYVLR